MRARPITFCAALALLGIVPNAQAGLHARVRTVRGGPPPRDHGHYVTRTSRLSNGSHYWVSRRGHRAVGYARMIPVSCFHSVTRRVGMGVTSWAMLGWRQISFSWCWDSRKVVRSWFETYSSWAGPAYCWDNTSTGVAYWDPSHVEIKTWNSGDLRNYFIWGCGAGDVTITAKIYAKGGSSFNYGR